MLPEDINAIENCAWCNSGRASLSGEVNVRLNEAFSVTSNARKAMIVVEKRVDSPEISPRSGGVGAFRQDKRKGKLRSL